MPLKDDKAKKAYRRNYYHKRKNTEEWKQKRARERPARLEKLSEAARQRRRIVYSRLSGECWCCSETHIEFLQVDANKGIREHYNIMDKKYRGGTNLWQWLIKNDFPDGFRLLCKNCAHSYKHYGYCPHHPNERRCK